MRSLTSRGATLLCLGLSCHPCAASEMAGLALPSSCADVSAASTRTLSPPRAGFSASRFSVRLPDSPRRGGPSLSAAELRVTRQTLIISDAALERAASAAAAALLITLTGNGSSGCAQGLLQDAGRPVAEALQQGGTVLGAWRKLSLDGAAGHVEAALLQIRLESAAVGAGDRPVRVTLTLDGITGHLTPPTLLPDHLLLRVSLPASSLPTLLAITGGGAPDARIPVQVEALRATRGRTVLSATGTATAAATPMQSDARLHLKAAAFDAIVQEAALRNLVRLHTALFLSGLMAHDDPDGLSWEVSFQDGLLAVNNVPIPLK